MAGDIQVFWDEAAVKLATEESGGPIAHAMAAAAAGVVHSMKAHCPVSPPGPFHRSGELRSSIKAFRQPGGEYLIGPTLQLPDGQFLGRLVEEGTRPHVIRSKGPWPLRNRETGQVFGREVHHPGTRPQPFIAPAAEELQGVQFHIA